MIKKLITGLLMFTLVGCGSATKTVTEKKGQLSVLRVVKTANLESEPGAIIYAKNTGNRTIKNAKVYVFLELGDEYLDGNVIEFPGEIEAGEIVQGSCYFSVIDIDTYYESILFVSEFDEV